MGIIKSIVHWHNADNTPKDILNLTWSVWGGSGLDVVTLKLHGVYSKTVQRIIYIDVWGQPGSECGRKMKILIFS